MNFRRGSSFSVILSHQADGGLEGLLDDVGELPGLVVDAGRPPRRGRGEGGELDVAGEDALHGEVGAAGDLAGTVDADDDLGRPLLDVGGAARLGEHARAQNCHGEHHVKSVRLLYWLCTHKYPCALAFR